MRRAMFKKSGRQHFKNMGLLLFFAFVFSLLTWRSLYGVDWTDEPFYAAEAYRIVQGDKLFSEIWTVNQLSALLYAPLVSFYQTVAGSMDGVILFLRLTYVVTACVVAACLCNAIREDVGTHWAALAGLPVVLCANPITFSYNNIRMLTYFLTCAKVVHARAARRESNRNFLLCAAGFAYTCGVLAYPSSLLTLPIFVLWVITDDGLAQKRWKNLLGCTLGGTLCILCVVLFASHNTSFGAFEFFVRRQINIHSESVHSPYGYVVDLVAIYGRWATLLFILTCLLAVAAQHKKDSCPLQVSFVLGIIALLALQCVQCAREFGLIVIHHRLFLALASIGPAWWLYAERARHWSMWFYVLGVVGSYVVYISSGNNSMAHSAYPYALSASATIIYIASNAQASNRRLPAVAYPINACMLAVIMFASMGYVYRDAHIPQLDTVVTQGPARGLRTTASNAEQYTTTIASIRTCVPQTGNVLYINLLPFGYLCTEAHAASWTTWSVTLDDEKLEQYYDMNPNRLPDTLYFVNKDYDYPKRNGEDQLGPYFKRYMSSYEWETIESDAGMVLRRGSIR